MKKRLLIALALLTSVIAVSCQKDNTDNKKFDVKTRTLSFKAEGGTEEIIVDSENVTWSITKKNDWLTVVANTETGKVKVTVAKNESGGVREGSITIGCSDFEPVNVAINQAYTPSDKGSIACDVKELKFGADGGTEKITVTAVGVEWSFDADEWITAERKDNVIEVTLSAFVGKETRAGSVTIKAEGFDNTVVAVEQEAKSLAVDKTSLSFDAEGGKQTVSVQAVNTTWDAVSDSDWLKITVEEGIISMEVQPNTDSEDRSGKITVSAKDFDDIVISVRQSAPEVKVLWERSSASLMNLKGKVKSVSYYYDFAAQTYPEIWDLQFAEDGTLTSFYNNKDTGLLPVKYALTYDGQKRLSEVKMTAETLNGTLLFTYSDHGLYLPLEEIFYSVSPRIKVANFSWLPRFIKGLESVTYADEDNYTNITYTVTGNTVTGNYNHDEAPLFHTINFENGYPKTFEYSLFGKKRRDYSMDTETGAIKTVEGFSMVSGAMTKTLTYVYNQDRINSLSKLDREKMPLSYTYDDNLNVISYVDKDGVTHSVSYEYDEQGNWISIQIDDADKVTREVVYFE